MKVIDFGHAECKQLEQYLDSYVNNELSVETSHKLVAHLEGCEACSREVAARIRLRAAVKRAIEGQETTNDVGAHIRERLREEESKARFRSWTIPLAVAASIAIAVTTWTRVAEPEPWEIALAGQESYIDALYELVPPMIRVGLGDHAHCAYFRNFEGSLPAAEMAEQLGPEYDGLMQLVDEHIPEDFKTVLGHQCEYRERKFIHLALKRNDELLSLVITRRDDGESFSRDELAPVLNAAGVSVYGARAGEFEVAGFEAGGYLGYVVSNLSNATNLEIAEAVVGPVSEYLGG